MERNISVEAVGEVGLRLQCGSTRVLVLGKEIGHRTEAETAFSVTESQIAERLVTEFASMNEGILPSCALLGMAAVRRNSLRILNKFRPQLDGQFLFTAPWYAEVMRRLTSFQSFCQMNSGL